MRELLGGLDNDSGGVEPARQVEHFQAAGTQPFFNFPHGELGTDGCRRLFGQPRWVRPSKCREAAERTRRARNGLVDAMQLSRVRGEGKDLAVLRQVS